MRTQEKLYYQLKEILKTTSLLLEDVVDDAGGMEIGKTKPPRSPETDYEERRSAVLNFAKSSQDAENSNDIFITSGYKLLDKAKKAGEDAQFKVKEMVVDLTKLANEIKELKGMDAEKVTVDRIRKVLRYVNTAVKNANKTIKELEDKRAKMEADIDWTAYDEELQKFKANLKQKYNIDKVEDVDNEIQQLENKISDSAQEIEQNNKEILREFREMIGHLYSIPEEIAETAKVYMQAYGAVASISKKATQFNMSKKGIMKILNDPDLYEQLGEFINVNEDVADRVQIMNSSIPEIGAYFAELNLKVDEQIEDIEEISAEFETKEKEINEAKVGKIFSKVKDIFTRAIGKFWDILTKETKDLHNKVMGSFKPVESSLEDLDEKVQNHKKEARSQAVKVHRMIKELELENAKQTEKNVA